MDSDVDCKMDVLRDVIFERDVLYAMWSLGEW